MKIQQYFETGMSVVIYLLSFGGLVIAGSLVLMHLILGEIHLLEIHPYATASQAPNFSTFIFFYLVVGTLTGITGLAVRKELLMLLLSTAGITIVITIMSFFQNEYAFVSTYFIATFFITNFIYRKNQASYKKNK
ncbi:MAG: hypothetical protein ACI83D_000287 [Planctomycetota bacterium]|jgi:hypothetical protein